MRPAVDVETQNNELKTLNISEAQFVALLREFVDGIEAFYGMQPIIYTSASEWQTLTADSSEFEESPLWIANVAMNDLKKRGALDDVPGAVIPGAPVEPLLPSAWRGGWYFWQYSWKGRIDGIAPLVDLDVFSGSYKDPTDFAGFTVKYEQQA